MTQPTLLSLETSPRLKMPKKQPDGEGAFRSMLDRHGAAHEKPKQNDAEPNEALGHATVRAQIRFEVARPSVSNGPDDGDGDTPDDLLADSASDTETDDDAVAAALAAGTAAAVSELRFLLGDARRSEHAPTEAEADDNNLRTPTGAKVEQAQTDAGIAGKPASMEGDKDLGEGPAALPGADVADAEQPAATGRAVAEKPAAHAAEKVVAPGAPETAMDAPKAGHEVAAAREAKPAADRITSAAGGNASPETRQDGAGQREGRNEGKPSLTGAAVVAEAPANSQAAPQPAARAVVVATLGADPTWTAYFRAKPTPAQATPQALTVQLRPAELGVVSAHLSFNGDSLTVELRPETQEAHNQLSRDSDAIARSLRAIGLEVDQVTVQPASTTQDGGRGALNARSDGQASSQQGQTFTSPDSQGDRGGGRQQGQGNPSGFGGRSGGDEIRGSAGGGDRDGRYI